ncbi:MAG TPA: hypothetical protein VN253_00590 [Kofleriaceae bacterium]|nr:hypothetical protein [Kofleriaceae bacterium]
MSIEAAIAQLQQQLTLTLTRRAGAAHPSALLTVLFERAAARSEATTFDRWIGEDDRLHPVGGGAEWLDAWFAALPDPFLRDHYGGLTLVSRGEPPLTLHYSRDFGPWFDRVRISIPWGAAPGERTTLTAAQLVELVALAAAAFSAEVAWLASFELLAAVRSATSGGVNDIGVPAAAFARFTTLQPHGQIDSAAVPEAVGWVNVWSPAVVDAIGRARVTAAPWQLRREVDGGWLLIATTEVPDRAHADAMARVAEIVEAIDLAGAHRRHPAPALEA